MSTKKVRFNNIKQYSDNIDNNKDNDDDQWEDIEIEDINNDNNDNNDINDHINNIIESGEFSILKKDNEDNEDNEDNGNTDDEILIKDKNDIQVNDGTDPCVAVDLINIFIFKQNQMHNSMGKHVFNNVDIKDPSSTNDYMEIFYEYMNEYKVLNEINQEYIDVYDEDTYEKPDIDCDIEVNTYALIENETNKILYLSMSYISLLYCGIETLKNKDNWNIIKL
jgi:hypothetical protein